jgi:esterase FrsA
MGDFFPRNKLCLQMTLHQREGQASEKDTRVGTNHAFSFIDHVAKKAHKHHIRSSPIELIVGPSIGYQGHGTSPEVFKAGANWAREALL